MFRLFSDMSVASEVEIYCRTVPYDSIAILSFQYFNGRRIRSTGNRCQAALPLASEVLSFLDSPIDLSERCERSCDKEVRLLKKSSIFM